MSHCRGPQEWGGFSLGRLFATDVSARRNNLLLHVLKVLISVMCSVSPRVFVEYAVQNRD